MMICFRKTSNAKVLTTGSDIKPKMEMAQSMEKEMQEVHNITQINRVLQFHFGFFKKTVRADLRGYMKAMKIDLKNSVKNINP